MIFDITIRDDTRGTLKVHTNCYWIEVKDENNNIVFERTPKTDDWLDDIHESIIDVLKCIEKEFMKRSE